MSDYKKEANKQVVVNVYVKCCDKDGRGECRHQEEETCVEVNVYAECCEKKHCHECEEN